MGQGNQFEQEYAPGFLGVSSVEGYVIVTDAHDVATRALFLAMHLIPHFRPFHSISNHFWDKNKFMFFFVIIDNACDPKYVTVSELSA